MAIKRYIATGDTSITDAYKSDLTTQATGSNMGNADSLQIFSLFGHTSTGSISRSRILVNYPIDTIISDRAAGSIPKSGSMNFVVRLYNVQHDETLPKDFTIIVAPLTTKFDEGRGVDLDGFKDRGIGNRGYGATWAYANSGSAGPNAWTAAGGDYAALPRYEQTFTTGLEDLEIDITGLVEQWIDGTKSKYGIGLFLTSSQEVDSGSISYYTKKFSARSSEFWFNRPVIEARWDSSVKDNRGNFHVSSAAESGADNMNTVYMYNYVRGQLKNLPDVSTGEIFVTLHTSRSAGEELNPTPTFLGNAVTGGFVSTGIYSASFALNTTASVIYDRWFSGSVAYHTGSLTIENEPAQSVALLPSFLSKITNLKGRYSPKEANVVFRVYTRHRNWSPSIYTKLATRTERNIVEDAYYSIVRTADNHTVIGFGTGSLNHTRLSYDASGSYFNLDMSMLQPDYMYTVRFAYYLDGNYVEQPDEFKFRVEEAS